MSNLKDAIGFLEAGDWESAHSIVQEDPSKLASWAHGIVHLLEGDVANAGYWYRRADRELRSNVQIAEEIAALKNAVG